MKQDYAEAVKWWVKAAKQGDEFAAFQLGRCYYEGCGVPTNKIEALKWFDLASMNILVCGSWESMRKKVASTLTAEEITEAEQRANQVLSEIPDTVRRDHAGAATSLGTISLSDKDYADALCLFRKAVRLGSADAMSALGFLYDAGLGVPQDIREAARLYRQAADLGSVEAQYNLATMLEVGRGTNKDYGEALKLFKLVVRSGATAFDIFAETHLGVMYRDGLGTFRDNREALRLFRDAAERGTTEAQYELGKSYMNGQGVPQNYSEAYFWLNLAAADTEAAREARDTLARLMTSGQIAEAQQRSSGFVPRKRSADGKTPLHPDPAQLGESAPRASGTGFFITDDGYMLTSWHVVEDAGRIVASTKLGPSPLKLVVADKANDIALLKADGKFAALLLSSSRGTKLGEPVFTIGFPNIDLQGFAPKLTKGEISSLTGVRDDPREFQISVAVQPGNSGGPVVNQYGNVIGIVEARLSDIATFKSTGSLPQTVNYAVKSSLLLSFLESVPQISDKLKEPNAKIQKFEDVVKAAEQAAVLVLVY